MAWAHMIGVMEYECILGLMQETKSTAKMVFTDLLMAALFMVIGMMASYTDRVISSFTKKVIFKSKKEYGKMEKW